MQTSALNIADQVFAAAGKLAGVKPTPSRGPNPNAPSREANRAANAAALRPQG